jgi:hypothetical protein
VGCHPAAVKQLHSTDEGASWAGAGGLPARAAVSQQVGRRRGATVVVRATPEEPKQEEEPVPVWVQREQEAKAKAESGEKGPLPYGLYLLGASLIVIAVVRPRGLFGPGTQLMRVRVDLVREEERPQPKRVWLAHARVLEWQLVLAMAVLPQWALEHRLR